MRVRSLVLSGQRMAARLSDDRGSIVPVVSLFVVGVLLVVAVIGASTEHYVRSAQAQWAANAAALAASGSGLLGTDEQAARALAEANGATLVSVVVVDGSTGPTTLSPTVVVEVEVGGVRAQAAAQRFATSGS